MQYTNILKSREFCAKFCANFKCREYCYKVIFNYSKHPWECKSIRYFAICSSYSSIAILFCVLAPTPTFYSYWTNSTSLEFDIYWNDYSACTYKSSFCVFIKGTNPNCSSSTLDNYSVLSGMICALLEFNGFSNYLYSLYNKITFVLQD